MSSTQMDLSPIVIERKQDITSWPEGDITRLTARDKKRYQRRKSAIEDYFKTDLSSEEISQRYHLAAKDSVEAMARRCLMLHEDGQLWGFRALLPGVKVVDRDVSTGTASDTRSDEEQAMIPTLPISEEGADEQDEEPTDKRPVVHLPVTPIPAFLSSDEASSVHVEPESTANVVATVDGLKDSSGDIVLDAVEASEVATLTSGEAHLEVQTINTPEGIVAQDLPVGPVAHETEALDRKLHDEKEPFVESEKAGPSLSVSGTSSESVTTSEGEIRAVAEVKEVEDEQATLAEQLSPIASEKHNAADEQAVEDDRTEIAILDTVEMNTVTGAIEREDDIEGERSALGATQPLVNVLDEGKTANEQFVEADRTEIAILDTVEMNTVTGATEREHDVENRQPAPEATQPLVDAVDGSKAANKQLTEREQAEIAALDTIEVNSLTPETERKVALDAPDLAVAIAPLASSAEATQLAPEPAAQTTVTETPMLVPEKQTAGAATVEASALVTTASSSQETKPEECSAEMPGPAGDSAGKLSLPAFLTPILKKSSLVTPVLRKGSLVLRAVIQSSGDTATETDTATMPSVGQVSPQEETDLAGEPTLSLEAAQRHNSRQLAMAELLSSPIRTLVDESRYRITGSQAAIRHSMLRRRVRQDKQQKHRRWVKIVSAAVIVALLVALLIPLAVGLIGYNTYTNIKGVANDGIAQLMTLKSLMPTNKNDITSALNIQKLEQAKTSLVKAQGDFLQLQDMVNRPDIQSLLQEFAPQYGNELGQSRHLIQIALDVSNMGQELIGVAEMGANIIHGSPLTSGSSAPLLTANDVNTVEATLVHAQYYLGDIQTQMSQVNLAQLPLGSASQKAQLATYLQMLPQIQSTLTQVQGLVEPVAWLLGVGQSRRFLVQTLDRGELRSSGGFEGQYGILTLQNGRMSPFSLSDITLLDYDENGAELGAHPPVQYSWMDFGNFGVRDANVSADFPTTAQLVMSTFTKEGGGPIDGDIQITPVVIEQFLQLTGSIYLSDYHQTVTAQNFENVIHEYQQDPRFINQQKEVTGTNTHETRKAFTSLIGQLLMARIKKMSVTQLMDFGKILLKDLKSRDLQIYFTNPVAEQWLTQNGDSAAMPKLGNGTDGFMVVQANVSISKASQYVQSTFTDDVKLDAQGGATHTLTINLNYDRGNNPVYGFNTYADYMRVYAPPNAQLLSAYGFNTGTTLCTPTGKAIPSTTKTGPGSGNGTGGGTGTGPGTGPGTGSSGGGTSYEEDVYGAFYPVYGCGQYDHYYPDSDGRYCPSGNYELGYDGMFDKPWAIQDLGGPSSSTSDLPGYKMWGGMTLTPTNCISTITLTWYVPHIVQTTAGQSPYQMVVGHQSGWPDKVNVSIDASALKGVKSLSYRQTIDDDTLVALANRPLPPAQQKSPSNTPAVTPTAKPKKP